MYGGDNIPTMTPLLPVTAIGTMASNMPPGMSYKPMTAFNLVSSLAEPMTPVQIPSLPQSQRPVQGPSGLNMKSPYSQLHHQQEQHQLQAQQQQHHQKQQQHQQHQQHHGSPFGSSPSVASPPDLSDNLSTSSSSSSCGEMSGGASGSGSSHLKRKGKGKFDVLSRDLVNPYLVKLKLLTITHRPSS